MDDTRRALLRSWLTKAASDLRGARILGSADDAPLDTAIYHCQQTAEKAVKAFLVSKELSPEKTRDIRKLTLAAAAHEPASTNCWTWRPPSRHTRGNSVTPMIWPKRIPPARNSTKPCNTPKPSTISC